MLDIDDSKGTTVVEKDDSNFNVVGDSNVSPDNDSKENSKGMEDDMFGDFATTNDDVATVKEEPMLDIDDSKGTTVVPEKDDSKENSKGMEDDMFGDFATTNDDMTTVKEDPMLDIDDSKGTTVVEKDDSNSNVVSDRMWLLIMIPKKIVKVWRTICLEILLQLMTVKEDVGYRR